MSAPARGGGLFLAVLGGYFALHVALRLLLGGALEADEAEMMLLGRHWRLAYGSQPPLYNWAQNLVFGAVGPTAFGIVGLRNATLFATYALTFAALHRVAPLSAAIPATLALGLLPTIAWWAQRTGSHSIALACLTAATLAAFLRLAERRRTADYLLFGLVVGLGGLAKLNYWVVPPALLLAALTLPDWRAAVADRRLALAGAAALAVVAAPYAAMLARPEASLADTWEFYAETAGPAWRAGLVRALSESAAALAPLALVVGVIFAARRRWPSGPGPVGALLLRAGGVGALLAAAAIVVADVSFVRSRWLLPLYMLVAPPLVIMALRGAGARALRVFVGGMAVLAALLVAGIVDVRLRGAGSDSLRFERLAACIEADVAPVPPVIGPHYITGNLARLRPGWTVLPPFPGDRLRPPPERVLVVDADVAGDVRRRLAEHGYPDPAAARVLARRTVEVPYRFTQEETRAVTFLIVAPP